MNKDNHISEEQLNAFVDGELESEEKSCLFDAAEQSAELDQRLCQQRKLKELVKHAYLDVPQPRRGLSGPRSRNSMIGLSAAASVLLAIGVLAGTLISNVFGPGQSASQPGTALTPQVAATMENYILHVVSGEPAQMKLALQRAKHLLTSAEEGKPRKVEIVANEEGLNLLRSDVTPFAAEISVLADEHVVFYACSKAIQRLEDKGVEVHLVPEAVSGYSALDRVVTRMNDGWQYIKI